jgi:hypothetical protein
VVPPPAGESATVPAAVSLKKFRVGNTGFQKVNPAKESVQKSGFWIFYPGISKFSDRNPCHCAAESKTGRRRSHGQVRRPAIHAQENDYAFG